MAETLRVDEISPCLGGDCPRKRQCERYITAPPIMAGGGWLDAPYVLSASGWNCYEFIEMKEASND